MIEINLLPIDLRPRESTNVPFLATIALGFIIVATLFVYWMKLESEMRVLVAKTEELTRRKDELAEDAKDVDKLKLEIERQKTRQQTIIEISQSKIMWSHKLEQFSQIMEQFPTFWVTQVSLTKASGSARTVATPNLIMRFSGMGGDISEVAKLREALQTDPNFFYHFSRLDNNSVTRTPLRPGDYVNATEKMDFEVKLPLTPSTTGPQPGRPGGR